MSAPATPPCPGLPRGAGDEPVFHAPWQAQAFAMAVELHAKGLFTWPEWAETLTRHLAPPPADGSLNERQAAEDYYTRWLAALEELVQAKGASTEAELQRHASAWGHAAHRTPHGQPIVLQPGDFDA